MTISPIGPKIDSQPLNDNFASLNNGLTALSADVTQRAINVMSGPFNAKGDGVTDDTTAIQAAIDFLPAHGGVVFLPKPSVSYKVTTLNITKSNVTILGDPSCSLLTSLTTTEIFHVEGVSLLTNITFRNLKLIGTVSNINQSGLRFWGVQGLVIENVWFEKLGYVGVVSQNQKVFKDVLIKDCTFFETVESGITVRPCENVTVDGCTFDHIYGNVYPPHGVYFRTATLDDSHTLKVVNCTFRNTPIATPGNGLAIKLIADIDEWPTTKLYNGVISNNTFKNYFGGVWIVNAQDVVVSNNIFDDIQQTPAQANEGAVKMESALNVVISGNVIRNAQTHAIVMIETCKDITITGNDINSKVYCVGAFSQNANTSNVNIIGNRLESTSLDGTIPVIDFGLTITNLVIKDNIILTGARGIQTRNTSIISMLTIENNIIKDGVQAAGFAINVASSSNANVSVIGNILAQCSGTLTVPATGLSHNNIIKNFEKYPVVNSYRGSTNRIDFGTAAPTTGSWTRGDTVFHTNPAEAGTTPNKYIITGYKCTATGTPGTWLEMRSLTGN